MNNCDRRGFAMIIFSFWIIVNFRGDYVWYWETVYCFFVWFIFAIGFLQFFTHCDRTCTDEASDRTSDGDVGGI